MGNRPKHTHSDSVVASELKYWGRYNAQALDWTGYSASSTIARLLEGWGGAFEHKVLIKDPPMQWWRINAKVQRLPRELITVLVARYCVPPKTDDDGNLTYYRRRELATACGLSEHEYRKRLRQAKSAYKRLIF